MSHLDTRTRTRPHLLLPDPARAADLGAVVVLATLALSGLATSFTGWTFLVVGVVGVVAGTAVTHVVRALGWPLVSAVVLLLLGVFWLLGGPLALRSRGDTAFLPGPETLAALADQAVFGWKDLLTTLPPVDGDGPLLVLPWLLGLAAGLLGTALAGASTRRPWLGAVLPVAGLTAFLAGVLLLGVRHPQSLLLQGALFAAVALGWLAVRTRRAGVVVHGGSPGWLRAVSGAGLVALAAALALPASALVAADDEGRVVARTWVEPPFDIGRYPSPLAGFRRYVDLQGRRDPANVHDRTLFTIDGVPAGTRVRIAALDHYDGMVWGASDDPLPGEGGDTFQRVSSTVDNPVAGERVEATVTIGEGWSGVWLPTVGALQEVDFRTGDPLTKSETFRYNLATSTAVVPSGLHEGDTYAIAAVQPDASLDRSTLPAAMSSPPPEGTAFLDGPVNQWAEGAGSTMAQVLAIAEHLRTEGKYSDGVVKDERQYHPGHGLHRLNDEFVSQQVMVGNDEQYAAAMALLAQKAGVPARVVLGAVVPEGGVVRGRDVAAWVELRAADGSWRTLPTEEFMSDEPPTTQLPETNEPMTGTVVPPPAPIPPPSDTGDLSDADLKQRKVAEEDEDADAAIAAGLPGWLVLLATWVGLPLLLVAAAVGSVVGAKAWRRHRRRAAASTSARFVGAWHDLVDHARDLGHPVPLGAGVTRREQSRGIGSERAPALAQWADGAVFGPRVPEAAAAAAYWEDVDRERRAMSRAVGRRRRWRAAVSLGTLRPGPRRGRRADWPSPAASD